MFYVLNLISKPKLKKNKLQFLGLAKLDKRKYYKKYLPARVKNDHY